MLPPLIEIGFILKSHGFKGHFKLYLKDEFAALKWDVSFLFVEIDNYKVPFKIAEILDEKNHIVKFEDINNSESLKPFLSKKIFIDQKYMNNSIQKKITKSEYDYLNGFTVMDQDKTQIGKILAIHQYPHQEMAEIRYKGNTILIPINPLLIIAENRENRMIQIEIVEGLLDLNV